ncbi:MAG TPA: sulfite exporter TauE/SafE family protein [Bryobacteraceae bacterium]|nr:sulfite exporter TauE/SafE family protein [Bryobacteraceae bacterium]
MEIVLGFLIAVAIGITGVGAGIITAPVLILFFHMPPAHAVGSALAFGVAVKLLVVPMQLYRKQVNFRVLGYMLAGGLPGVAIGSVLLAKLNTPARQGILFAALGSTIVLMAALNLYRLWLRPAHLPGPDRTTWLPLVTLPIGAEVGFSSAGAGALGSLVLLAITPLTAAQVVGTDLFFGLCVSLVGSGFQLSAGNYDPLILTRLIIGGLAGAIAGTYLATIAPQRVFRVALSVWLISLGIQLCWSGFNHW